MKVLELAKEEEFSSEHYVPKFLHSSEKVRLVLVCLEAGQEVAPHATPEATLHVLKGKGTISVGQDEIRVEGGSLVVCPPGVSHGVKSQERMVLLATVATG